MANLCDVLGIDDNDDSDDQAAAPSLEKIQQEEEYLRSRRQKWGIKDLGEEDELFLCHEPSGD